MTGTKQLALWSALALGAGFAELAWADYPAPPADGRCYAAFVVEERVRIPVLGVSVWEVLREETKTPKSGKPASRPLMGNIRAQTEVMEPLSGGEELIALADWLLHNCSDEDVVPLISRGRSVLENAWKRHRNIPRRDLRMHLDLVAGGLRRGSISFSACTPQTRWRELTRAVKGIVEGIESYRWDDCQDMSR